MLSAMKRLKRYLEENVISQVEIARQLGVTQPTVWEWLNDESKPTADNLMKLSRVTGISIDDLLSHAA